MCRVAAWKFVSGRPARLRSFLKECRVTCEGLIGPPTVFVKSNVSPSTATSSSCVKKSHTVMFVASDTGTSSLVAIPSADPSTTSFRVLP